MESGFDLAQRAHQDGLKSVIHEELNFGRAGFLAPVIDTGKTKGIELELQEGVGLVDDGSDALYYEFHN
jgi:hypothetical protein